MKKKYHKTTKSLYEKFAQDEKYSKVRKWIFKFPVFCSQTIALRKQVTMYLTAQIQNQELNV